MIKLSIIIPYYNTKKYTNELIAVLAPQRNKNVEIIVVDDGSSECFFCEFDGIKTIRKKNGGVSSARNRGLREAKGEYIAFIDNANDPENRGYNVFDKEKINKYYEIYEIVKENCD